MPAIQIDEEEFRRLKLLQSQVGAIVKHPKAALLIEQAHKMVDERAPTPKLDAARLADEAMSETAKQLKALQDQVAADKAQAEQDKKLNAIRANHDAGFAKLRANGWTDEGVAGVQKIMEEQGILDPAIAAAYFEKLHPPQNPIPPGGSGSWDFFSAQPDGAADDLKKLIDTRGESNAVVDKLVRDALLDVRGQPRAR